MKRRQKRQRENRPPGPKANDLVRLRTPAKPGMTPEPAGADEKEEREHIQRHENEGVGGPG